MWLRGGGVVVCALIATVGLNLDVAVGPTKAVQVRSVSVALVGMWVSFSGGVLATLRRRQYTPNAATRVLYFSLRYLPTCYICFYFIQPLKSRCPLTFVFPESFS